MKLSFFAFLFIFLTGFTNNNTSHYDVAQQLLNLPGNDITLSTIEDIFRASNTPKLKSWMTDRGYEYLKDSEADFVRYVDKNRNVINITLTKNGTVVYEMNKDNFKNIVAELKDGNYKKLWTKKQELSDGRKYYMTYWEGTDYIFKTLDFIGSDLRAAGIQHKQK